jgi:excisionase family DNA binding protein
MNYVYSTSEVAKTLRIHPATVRKLWREKRLAGLLLGNRLRFTAEALAKFLKGERQCQSKKKQR